MADFILVDVCIGNVQKIFDVFTPKEHFCFHEMSPIMRVGAARGALWTTFKYGADQVFEFEQTIAKALIAMLTIFILY